LLEDIIVPDADLDLSDPKIKATVGSVSFPKAHPVDTMTFILFVKISHRSRPIRMP
jgi:hypothetical protein